MLAPKWRAGEAFYMTACQGSCAVLDAKHKFQRSELGSHALTTSSIYTFLQFARSDVNLPPRSSHVVHSTTTIPGSSYV